MTYKKWIDRNYEKLQEKYDEYFELVDNTIITPMSFDEFILEEWDKVCNDYREREERA